MRKSFLRLKSIQIWGHFWQKRASVALNFFFFLFSMIKWVAIGFIQIINMIKIVLQWFSLMLRLRGNKNQFTSWTNENHSFHKSYSKIIKSFLGLGFICSNQMSNNNSITGNWRRQTTSDGWRIGCTCIGGRKRLCHQ
jgi:hypothetical protein